MEDKKTNVKIIVLLPKQTFLYTTNQESASDNTTTMVFMDRLVIVAKEKAQYMSTISVMPRI